jgi:hypothetical protein
MQLRLHFSAEGCQKGRVDFLFHEDYHPRVNERAGSALLTPSQP